ncbi:MAG: hypothetical protein PHQ95_03425 [Candidatus Gracilibacteria bacterium]|nr:hypothetical protein [Candidatus Gracilibacteria bacterium]
MSPFIEKLEQIKKDSFHLSEIAKMELVDEFNFQNTEDKDYILGNYKGDTDIGAYQVDIYDILKKLLDENKIPDPYKNEIIENYRLKYLEDKLDNKSLYLSYIKFFLEKKKESKFKEIFKELYDHYSNDNIVWQFIDIFQSLDEKEYFIKSFNEFLEKETQFGNKYINKSQIAYLLNLNKDVFSIFLDLLSKNGLLYLNELDLKETKKFIKNIESLSDPTINNRLKDLFLSLFKKLEDGKTSNHRFNEMVSKFLKSEFGLELSKYLGNIYNDLSIEVIKTAKNTIYVFWDIIKIISDLLRIENVKELCEISGSNFYDVHIYEYIEGGKREDKEIMKLEFKKYESFNKKLSERQKYLKKVNTEQKRRKTKERRDFDKGIEAIKEAEKRKGPSKGISEYLLYQFENSEYPDFKTDKNIRRLVKKHIKRFFKLDASNPDLYELHYTEKNENSSSYTTHQFVVNGTFLRCLRLYKVFGFNLQEVREKAIKYIPFTYSDDIEIIKSVIDGNLNKDEVKYLVSIFDGSRTKDDLRYFNIQPFIIFYENYKDDFIKHDKKHLEDTFLNIINNSEYKGYDREYVAEKLVEIGSKDQLLGLFNKYKTESNYFLDILSKGANTIESHNFKIASLSGKFLLKRFENLKNKKDIIDWYIRQLKKEVSFIEPENNTLIARGVSPLESEISWFGRDDDNFILAFRYIRDLSFEEEIKKLLKYSFEISEEAKEYKTFGKYIQKAVFYFYEGIEKKKLESIFLLEKYIYDLSLKDNEIRISFKINYLDKLINDYSEKYSKAEVAKVYKDVYSKEKDGSDEIVAMAEEITFLKRENSKLELENISIKNNLLETNQAIVAFKEILKVENLSCILFVEGESDKNYLNYYYSLPLNEGGIHPFIIQGGGSRGVLSFLEHYESVDLPKGLSIIGMFDFDMTGYDQYLKLKHINYSKKDGGKYDDFEIDYHKGKCKKHKNKNIYAFLLPVPNNNIKDQVLKDSGNDYGFDSKLEIEHLFYNALKGIDDDKNKKLNEKLFTEKQKSIGGGEFVALKDDFCKSKATFSNELLNGTFFGGNFPIKEELFINFLPIINLVEKIIVNAKKP